jgi:CubicO group peptidase (beta-lactamase class C family)
MRRWDGMKRMSGTKKLGAFFLCCVIFSMMACGEAKSQNSYDSAISTARGEIWRAINSGRCASATVAIMADGTVVYAEGFGMANREKSIPVDPDTLFNIGSISKVYDAAAIMLLVDDGKVSLDRPVTEYLPEFRMADSRYKNITVRMTLNHTSGLPGTEGANTFGFAHYYDNAKKETLATLAHSHLKHSPGEMAVYCNDGFTLAEMIVERASGKKFSEFLSERVFKPLDLKNTGVSVGEIRDRTRAAYYDPETGKIQPFEVASLLGAGGLSSTAVDLCRFLDTFSSQNRIFSKASLAEMRKGQPPAVWGKLRNPEISCGLGWDMTDLPRYKAAGLQVLGKSGGTGNYSSMCFTVPDKRISVAVIACGPKGGAIQMAFNILEAVLEGRGLMAREKKSLAIPMKPETIPQDLMPYAGYYGGDNKMGKIAFDMNKNAVTLTMLRDGEKASESSFVYNNGYFHGDGGNRCYFASINQRDYFVSCLDAQKVDMISLEKVKPLEKPQNLKISMDRKLWLRRNVSPFEGKDGTDSHVIQSMLYKELPGYVNFMGLKRIETPEFAAMPFSAIRDQTELALFNKGDATWAQLSDMIYSPADNARAMKTGENTVKIDSLGQTEWLKADDAVILSFIKPKQGRIIVFSPDRTVKYDSAVDTGELYVTKGSFVECAGLADDVFTVRGISVDRP